MFNNQILNHSILFTNQSSSFLQTFSLPPSSQLLGDGRTLPAPAQNTQPLPTILTTSCLTPSARVLYHDINFVVRRALCVILFCVYSIIIDPFLLLHLNIVIETLSCTLPQSCSLGMSPSLLRTARQLSSCRHQSEWIN